MVVGCGLTIAGILCARVELAHGSHLHGAPLSVALALAGLGFGVTVVPMTSSVLSHIPGRHSGMAASATNTARQLGAVAGVAALGSLVNAHLVHAIPAYLGQKVEKLLPTLKPHIVNVLETGGTGGVSLRHIPPAFVTAFLNGLQVALLIAAALIALAGIAAALAREPAEAPDAAATA